MIQFSTIDEALCDLRAGKIILVTDDPTRENEGDFICAAEFATTENHQLHGDLWQRADLYAHVAGLCGKAENPTDGTAKYR